VEGPLLGGFIVDDRVPHFGLLFGNHDVKFKLECEINLELPLEEKDLELHEILSRRRKPCLRRFY
jgi:hypothetical protein